MAALGTIAYVDPDNPTPEGKPIDSYWPLFWGSDTDSLIYRVGQVYP